MRPFVLAVSAVTMAALAAGAPAGQAPADDLFERARAINRASPLIDGHNDYPWAVREDVPTLDLAAIDIRGAQPKTMTDIPRLRAGGVGGQFWSVYVPASLQGQAAITAVLEQIDVVHRMVAPLSRHVRDGAHRRRRRAHRQGRPDRLAARAWKAATRSTTRSARCGCCTRSARAT